ncbi:MAG: hypothetical protein DRQ56_00445 [Gammaproteobacteria bacterium]|nr:MAG: hypothetical protein DRQ56_00445 [Gammaproteobacteria bacterium]
MANKKKRFGGGSSLIKGIAETVRDRELGEEEFLVERVDIEKIKPDPENPRLLGLTEDELLWLQNIDYVEEARASEAGLEERIKTLLKLRDLADSIKANGLMQPIRIYRLGEGFRIESGERRYWGTIVAKQSKIPAIILPERPKRLRTLQLIENLQRDDLDLKARLRNIVSVVCELEEEGVGAPLTSIVLGEVIGTSRRQATKYLSVIRSHETIMLSISSGIIDNLDVAVELSKIDNPEQLDKTIKAYAKGLTRADVKKEMQPQLELRVVSKKGRPAKKINLGATKNSSVVKHIMEIGGAEDLLSDVDWSDFKAVSIAWTDFLRGLEKDL